MLKPQAVEKVITRANHPPTNHLRPSRDREINPSQGHHNSVPLVFINTLGWRETTWREEHKAPSLIIQEKRVSHHIEIFKLSTSKDRTYLHQLSCHSMLLMGVLCPLDRSSSPRSFCLLYTSPSPRDLSTSRMPSSA